jgi:hypothetical protein
MDDDHVRIAVVRFDLVLPNHSALFHPSWCRVIQLDVKDTFKRDGTSFTQLVRDRGSVFVDPEMLQSRKYDIFLPWQCPG